MRSRHLMQLARKAPRVLFRRKNCEWHVWLLTRLALASLHASLAYWNLTEHVLAQLSVLRHPLRVL